MSASDFAVLPADLPISDSGLAAELEARGNEQHIKFCQRQDLFLSRLDQFDGSLLLAGRSMPGTTSNRQSHYDHAS
ncbi:MAG: hypothetical protein K0U69_05695 [Actinomycetia bacterium]|nr:hypothetical protein [Actinomycetes bacterium]MCH9708992.1 hypothetical protein [Actinomycetes bacterium]